MDVSLNRKFSRRKFLALGATSGIALFVLCKMNNLRAEALRAASSSSMFQVKTPLGIDFIHRNSPTTNKYLIETMGGGVGLLDYNNDGLLDIFLVNGGYLEPSMPTPENFRLTIVVVISEIDSHAGECAAIVAQCRTSFFGPLRKGAVSIVMEQELFHSVVRNENVLVAIAVVIRERHA